MVSSLAGLPAEAARDREVWGHYGIKTALTIPLSAGGGPVFGCLSFNDMRTERCWSGTLVQRLQLVAQVFANAPGTRRLHLQTLRQEGRVRASVRDEGGGLPEDVERIFQLFYTTKSQGLGWAWLSAGPSWRHTTAGFGRQLTPSAAPN
jgi:hypothetical protein